MMKSLNRLPASPRRRWPQAPALVHVGLLFSLAVGGLHSEPTLWFPPILDLESGRRQLEDLEKKEKETTLSTDEQYQLGVAYLLYSPSTKMAVEHLRKAASMEPDHFMALFLCTLAMERTGNYADAVPLLLHICDREPGMPLGELAVRTLHSYRGHLPSLDQKMETVFGRMLKDHDPGNPRYHCENHRRFGPQGIQTLHMLRVMNLTNPDFVHIAREMLAGIQFRSGRIDAHRSTCQAMGEIARWRVAGPFGSMPNLDFDTVFPPETESPATPEYSWQGKTIPAEEVFCPGDEIRPSGKSLKKGTFYATTQVYWPDPGAIVWVSSTDHCRIFIDGRCVFVRDARRDWQRTKHRFTVLLSKGWHRFTVKFSSEVAPAGFRLFVTNPYGGALTGLRIEASLREPPSPEPGTAQRPLNGRGCPVLITPVGAPEPADATDISPTPVMCTAESYCDELLQKSPDDPWAHFVKAWLASENGNFTEARVEAEKAVAAAPHVAEFHFYLARYFKEDSSLPSEEASSMARKHYGKTAELVKDFAAALDELSEYDVEEEHHLKAIRKLQDCLRISPSYWAYHASLFSAFRAKGWNDLATESLHRALRLNPEAHYALTLGLDWFGARWDFAEADRCEKAFADLMPLHERTALFPASRGQLKESAQDVAKLVQWFPWNLDNRLVLANLLRRMGETECARQVLDSALAMSPSGQRIRVEQAGLSFQEGRIEEGRSSLEQALAESPTDFSIRQALIALGRKDEFEPFRIPLETVLQERESGRQYRGASTVYLLDQYVTRVFPDGSSLDLTHIIAQILDKDGVERWGEMQIPRGASIYHLRVVKPDRTVLEPEIMEQKASFTMTGLAPGDILEFEHLAASRGLDLPGGYAGANFTFNSIDIPTERAQLVIMTQGGYPLQYQFRNAAVAPVMSQRDGLTVYQWDMKNPRPVSHEAMSVPYQEYLPHVQFSGGLTWDLLRQDFANRMVPLLRLSPEMRGELEERVPRDVAEKERARRIFEWAQDRVRNPGPPLYLGSPANRIYHERSGNLLVLLKAMYDAAGIPADILLAYSKADPLPVLEVPGLGTFRHALLRVRPRDGDEIWLDPTSNTVAYGYLRPDLGGTKGLGIFGAGPPLTEIPPPPPDQDLEGHDWVGAVNAEGELECSATFTYRGGRGAAFRRLTQDWSPQRWLQLAERDLSRTLRGASVKDVRPENLENPRLPLSIRYQFTVRRFGQKEGRTLRLNQALGPGRFIDHFAQLPRRSIPLLIPFHTRIQTTISIQFPPGSQVREKPADLQLETPNGTFVSKASGEGRSFRLERSVLLPIQRVAPDKYEEFARFCRSVDKNETEEIVVLLPE